MYPSFERCIVILNFKMLTFFSSLLNYFHVHIFYWHLYVHFSHVVIEPPLNVHNNITFSNWTSQIPLNNATIPVGCRYPKLHWCVTIPKMYFFQYVLGMVFLSVGYPAAAVLCYSMFSKVLGPTPQVIYVY